MKKLIIPLGLLVLYCVLLIEVLVLKSLPLIRVGHMMFNFGGTQDGPANLIPLKTLVFYLSGRNGFLIAAINILGNIIALVPLGLLMPFVFSNMNWKKTILLAIITGILIETTQVIMHIGIFDIDDVLLNGVGVIIGFWMYTIYAKFSEKVKRIMNVAAVSISLVFILLCGLSYYKMIKLPISLESNMESNRLPPMPETGENKNNPNCCDLCNGTGGTGEIISTDSNAITIKSRAGKVEKILLTNKTTVKDSKGIASSTLLKVGDHVTVIIDESETASLVLICGIK
jgi:glycopeptide antibiotics resistance protein